jgi:hypothetical protein
MFISKYKTATCFGTEVPSSGSYLNKGINQHAYVSILSLSLKQLKYYNYKMHKVNDQTITLECILLHA